MTATSGSTSLFFAIIGIVTSHFKMPNTLGSALTDPLWFGHAFMPRPGRRRRLLSARDLRRNPASAARVCPRMSARQQVRLGQIDHLVTAPAHDSAYHPEAKALDLLRGNRRGHRKFMLGGYDVQNCRTVVIQNVGDSVRQFAGI